MLSQFYKLILLYIELKYENSKLDTEKKVDVC